MDLIREGALREIHHVDCRWVRRRGIPGLGKWPTIREKSEGGALIDCGIHLLDTAWAMIGKPEPALVTGTSHSLFGARIRDYEYDQMWGGPPQRDGVLDVEDPFVGHALFAGGASLTLHVAWAAKRPGGPVRDWIPRDGRRAPVAKVVQGLTGPYFEARSRRCCPPDDHRGMYERFFDCLAGREEPPPARDALAVHAMLDGWYESDRTNRPVQILPVAGSYELRNRPL